MKLVINHCYGGFSLSHDAIMEYGKRKGIALYPEIAKSTADIHMKVYGKAPTFDEAFVVFYYTEPEAKRGKDSYFDARGIPRDCPVLVQLVQDWGEKANGQCAALAVIEIPDGVSWQVEEYDGFEHIAEKHRTWPG